jgi:murein DD-endopeptidase MepM/ murein hydrolase activator NlpD
LPLFAVLAGILLTLLFMRAPERRSDPAWNFHSHRIELKCLIDSLGEILADTIDTRITVIGEEFLGGALREIGLTGNGYLMTCAILMDSLGWNVQQPGDTLEAVYYRDVLSELRCYPSNRRGFYRIALQDGSPCAWNYVPEERWIRQRAVSCPITTTVWGALRDHALPEDLTPSGHVATWRDTVRAAGYVSELQHELTDRLFAFDIDFYYDVREGDRVWILLEEVRYPETSETSFRRILAAKYEFSSGGLVEAIPYFHIPEASGEEICILDHYHRGGESLRTMFLKMPVPFGRISSGYSMARDHPILGYNRAHQGIDYAAPMGTEIFAVGDGTITMRSWHGGYGNYVRVRHANGYETGYGHMSSFATGQSVGTYVRQGQVVGYVGSTGLSTGPHVHFEMKRNGSFVNPATEILPPADPLEGSDLDIFLVQLSILEAIWNLLSDTEVPVPPREIAMADSTTAV